MSPSVRSGRRLRFVALSLGLALGLATGAPASLAATGWRIVPTSDPSAFSYVYALDGTAATDVWIGGGTAQDPFVEHFDGRRWTATILPNPGATSAEVEGIAAVARTDVWAVGSEGYPNYEAFAEHWDGAAWSIVPTPPTDTGALEAVAAVSSDDVWAAGSQYEGALFMHWNGVAWTEVPTRFREGASAIDAAAADDVWAVGRGSRGAPAVYHFDGSRWSSVPSPHVGVGPQGKLGIAAFGEDDVWIGYTTPLGHQGFYVVGASHWDGASWTNVRISPDHVSDYDTVAVAGASGDDVWLATTNGFDQGLGRTYTAHFDGSAWAVVPSPNPGTYPDELDAAAVLGDGSVWAAGYASPFSGVESLVLRYGG